MCKRTNEKQEYALARSKWSFETATELSAALAAKKVSAVELAQDAIGRIERHDGKINAICVRDFARGLEAARAAAYDLGLSGAEGFYAAGRRAVDFPCQGSGRRDPRQDQRAGRARRLAEL